MPMMAKDHHENLEQKRLRQTQQQLKRMLAESHQSGRRNKGPATRRDRRRSQEEKYEEHAEEKKGPTVEERKKKKKKQQPINGRMMFVFFIGVVVGAFIRKDFFCWAMAYLFWAVGLIADIATILAARLLGVY
jgi:hypothetical protein